jgi:methionyl-tRNA formyltransferase
MLNIAFFGTPELCIPYLESLKRQEIGDFCIITNPSKPLGRKAIITPSPVFLWGESHHITTFTPEKIDSEFLQKLKNESNWDLFIVVAYGHILPQELIEMPRFGTWNVHYSLLPKHRGSSCVESAILCGDLKTGVCVQKMLYALDAGDILNKKTLPLSGNEYASDIKSILTNFGVEILEKTLQELQTDTLIYEKQDESQKTVCRKIKKEYGEVDLHDNSTELWKKYRAYKGWPDLFYIDSMGKRVKILEAAMIEGKFTPTIVVPEGKPACSFPLVAHLVRTHL